MKSKPLIATNPYLKDAKLRRRLLALNVSTSSAIETSTPLQGFLLPEGEPFIAPVSVRPSLRRRPGSPS
jgi:hypothetical protein